MSHRTIIFCIVCGLLLFIAVEVLIVLLNGKPVDAPSIPRSTQQLGVSDPELNYVVMGDSTSIGQGTSYEHSYAFASAQHLAQTHRVAFTNVGVSGARAHDVLADQLPKAVALRPDIVLLAVGANDATHLSRGKTVETSLQATIDGLRRSNPDVKIVVTATPAMGSVPRFAWPVKQLAGVRTTQVNAVYNRLIPANNLVLAPIARDTGKAFLENPGYFAQDKFHPNAEGYKLWIPVINRALDKALAR